MAKGLNFAVSPEKLPVNDIIVQTEKACSMLPVEERDGLRAEVCGALKSTQLPKPNIIKEERTAIRNIGKDKSVLPADKGKATVIMDTEEYEKKVREMLSDEKTYSKLNSDPTPKYKKKLVAILDRLKSEKKITSKQHQYLIPSSENQNMNVLHTKNP